MADTRSQKERMLAGEHYFANDPELTRERKRAKALCARYNQSVVDLDQETLAELLGAPSDAHLEPPFYCDYGTNLRLGKNVYANHNLVALDVAEIHIGDNVFMGPNVVLSTAGHPIDAAVRITGAEFGHPITIEDNVWIGANVVVLPGVRIGRNTTIGAGSVVTRSIPPDCVAVGNPCRVLRHLKG